MNIFSKEHKSATWGTIVLHLGLLCLLLFFGFYTPLPLPEEEGVEVNFGNSDLGFGKNEEQEASPKTKSSVKQANNEPMIAEKLPIEPSRPIPQENTTKTESADNERTENLMTQDYEESVLIKQKKKDEEKKRVAEEQRKKNEERKRIAEEQRKKNEEQKRQQEKQAQKIKEERLKREAEELKRKDEADRKRKEAEEKRKQEQRKKQAEEISKRVANAFGKNDNAAGDGIGNSSPSSQGITSGAGNQGVSTGAISSDNYGSGGRQGNGISYSLGNRKALSLPTPSYPGTQQETVVVEVSVDKRGNVIEANPGAQGSTTMNSQLLSVAKKAAMESKFSADENAPAHQKGTITYVFILR
ncbi:MAG: hypothetical protein ACK5L5_02725 [Bacteroidales bacterium]